MSDVESLISTAIAESSAANVNSPEVSLSRPTVIILLSKDCYAVPIDQLPNLTSLKCEHLAYVLEQFLPHDAESIAVSTNVKTLREKSSGLCIAVHREKIQSMIESHEANGEWIAGVTPKAFLAVEALLQDRTIEQDCVVIWQSDEHALDLLTIRRGKVIDWRWISDSSLEAELKLVLERDAILPLYFQLSEGKPFPEIGMASATALQITQDEAVDRIRPRIYAGKYYPSIDLRSSQLKTKYRLLPLSKTLGLALGGFVLALSATAILLSLKALDCAQEADLAMDQQLEVFRELFPGQRIPGDIPGRLASERRKLLAETAELNNQPRVASVLPTVIRLFDAIPENAGIRVDFLSVSENTVNSIDGAVESLEDHQSILESFKAKRFTFAPPRIEQRKEGYSMQFERLQLKPETASQ